MKLVKKIIIKGKVEAKTGLHIGGSDVGLSIGGADSPVIRDPLTNTPYIPGSSIKGKMKSLLDRVYFSANDPDYYVVVVKGDHPIRIHLCKKGTPKEEVCNICKLFGLPAEHDGATPPRLYVRDAMMNKDSVKELLYSKNTDMPYTEVKTEVVIDRVTSAATLRQIERVPAGAVFELEMVLNIYEGDDEVSLRQLIEEGRRLLNDDYLGGSGTRGYGKVVMTFDALKYKDEAVYKGDNQALPLEG